MCLASSLFGTCKAKRVSNHVSLRCLPLSFVFFLHLLSTTRRQLNKLFMPIDSAQCFCSALRTKLLTLFSFHQKINDKWNATPQQKQKEKCTDNQSRLFVNLEVMNLWTELLFILEESALNCSATSAQIIAEHGKIITFSMAHCLACHVHAVRLQPWVGIICICTRSKRPALIRPGVTRFQMTADA